MSPVIPFFQVIVCKIEVDGTENIHANEDNGVLHENDLAVTLHGKDVVCGTDQVDFIVAWTLREDGDQLCPTQRRSGTNANRPV